jgi:anthranilate phosphoribosyltransferase
MCLLALPVICINYCYEKGEVNEMIKEAIVKIVNKQDLTYEEAYEVMNEIMSGKTTSTQNAAFLAALSTKSARAETTDEIAGCAAAMREHAIQVDTNMELFEIVGTGGDNARSFNISRQHWLQPPEV